MGSGASVDRPVTAAPEKGDESGGFSRPQTAAQPQVEYIESCRNGVRCLHNGL